jgi:predicted nucleic acid-binding protein
LSCLLIDLNIADCVVELRAQYRFKTQDAIQLGTAIAFGADYILTNDIEWQQFEEVKMLLVVEL